ncbi:MAG: NERD domain-containing protein [Bacteroidales bacterium]|jgi:hypothetical protein|nr:NERD domain-containing protein [Bacteroidales bacterium]
MITESIVIIIIIIGFVLLFVCIEKNIRDRESLEVYRKLLEADRKLLETVTNLDRGTNAERDMVLKFLKHGIASQTIFHDLYLKKYNGNFSQIDLVVATKVGIIVFEIKDYSGWIFGNGYHSQWTQILAYGKQKYRFYNPIMQNNKHITELKKQLKQTNVPFFSVIVFYGDCVLKDISFVPDRTYIVKQTRVFDVIDFIMKNNIPAHYTNKIEVINILKEAVKNGESKDIRIQHIENINDMLGKDRIFD